MRHPRINTNKTSSTDPLASLFEKNLNRVAVQPRKQTSIYDQISSIMGNSKPKFSSVQEKVNEMLERSGLHAYLQMQNKVAEEEDRMKTASAEPKVFAELPHTKQVIENIIKDSHGNLTVPSIFYKLKSILGNDVSDQELWNDEELLKYISALNMGAKKDNSNNVNYSHVGLSDKDQDIDPANVDAFFGLNPAKSV